MLRYLAILMLCSLAMALNPANMSDKPQAEFSYEIHADMQLKALQNLQKKLLNKHQVELIIEKITYNERQKIQSIYFKAIFRYLGGEVGGSIRHFKKAKIFANKNRFGVECTDS